MPQTINVKTLMHEMRQVVERVRMTSADHNRVLYGDSAPMTGR